MSFSEAMSYQRDILALKSRILAAMMPCDRETGTTSIENLGSDPIRHGIVVRTDVLTKIKPRT
jgi:hypothetical protein